LVFVVVYSIVGTTGIVGHEIVVAYFLIWSLECCRVLGLCCFLNI
jgi:hypothetical protein